MRDLVVGNLYSNEDIFTGLGVGNAGGIRLSIKEDIVVRAAIMTSLQDFRNAIENPYHDRLEGEILTYTAGGKLGGQTLAGLNQRIIEQRRFSFPIHGFVAIADRRDISVGPKRWKYLGLLEYKRHYQDSQLGSDGRIRQVWIFEFRIHQELRVVPLAIDSSISREVLTNSRISPSENDEEIELVSHPDKMAANSLEQLEEARGKLLAMQPREFELFIKDLMLHTGFVDVCVTKTGADGGVDVAATAGDRMWIFERAFVQVQAKRWLHSVGRKEVAELRGSLQPHSRGALVTTSHFTRAAIIEAGEQGKNPITLVDGYRLSRIVLSENFSFSK